MQRVVILLALLFTVFRPAFAQDAWNCTPLGISDGRFISVALEGDLAYVGAGQTLVILDVSNPAAPQRLGSVQTPDLVKAIAVVEGLVFVANNEAGLLIVDASDPTAPHVLGQVDSMERAVDVVWREGLAYVVDDAGGRLRILDVGDPAHPIELGGIDTGGSPHAVVLEGDRAYVKALDDNDVVLLIINVEEPAHPQTLGSLELFGVMTSQANLAVRDGIVFVADYFLTAIDTSDPIHPTDLYMVEIPCSPFRIVIQDQIAYMGGWDGVCAANISNSNQPLILDTAEDLYGALDFDIRNGLIGMVAEEEGLVFVDGSDPANLQLVGSLADPGGSSEIALLEAGTLGLVAVAATRTHALQFLDANDPSLLHKWSTYTAPFNISAVAAGGSWVCGMGYTSLQLISAANPVQPAGWPQLTMPTELSDLDIDGDRIAVLRRNDLSLGIIQSNSPTNPVLYGSLLMNGYQLDMSGNLICMVHEGRVRLVDSSNPTHLQELAPITTPGYASEVVCNANRLYVADGETGLLIYDVGDPENPVELGSLDTEGYVNHVVLTGDLAYLLDSVEGLLVVDVNDAAHPQTVGYHRLHHQPSNLAAHDNLAFISLGSIGVQSIRYDGETSLAPAPATPASCLLFPNEPNPFNPTTTLSYELLMPQEVSLRVFDLAGRLVRELVNGPQPAGSHEVLFDGSRLASGVYLAELRAGGRVETRKMLLLK